MTISKAPSCHAKAVAMFRYGVIGSLLSFELEHGELRAQLRTLAVRRFRPPGSTRTRVYGLSTIERWYYAYLRDGLDGLTPGRRSDSGRATALAPELRELLLAIRREFPTASSPLIIRTLIDEGVLERGVISIATLNRLYAEHDLRRQRRGPKNAQRQRRERRRWQVGQPGELWHGDVCHGPTLVDPEDRSTPVRIHALLDDASRFIVALEVHTHEREVEMLGLLARAIQRHGAPARLYLDNGSTYRGEDLASIGARLKMGVIHAAPYDPQARGKMERFWRTMREQCLDFIGPEASLHDVRVRLNAWLDQRYLRDPHAGLMGKSPRSVWEKSGRTTRRIDHDTLLAAFTTREQRRVRKDGTLSIKGTTYEVAQGHLAGKTVEIVSGLAPFDRDYRPQVLVEGIARPLHELDVVANSARHRKPIPVPETPLTTGFDPTQTNLDRAAGRPKKGKRS
jgi:putative transposase